MQIIPLADERAKAPPVITNSRDYPIFSGQEAGNTGPLASRKVVKSPGGRSRLVAHFPRSMDLVGLNIGVGQTTG